MEEPIVYDDLDSSLSVASTSYQVTNVWEDGIILKEFRQTINYGESYVSDNCLCVKPGSYLYIRVENNSGLNKNILQSCAISFMNLMIRAI